MSALQYDSRNTSDSHFASALFRVLVLVGVFRDFIHTAKAKTDTKLRLHNVTSKASSENCIINTKDDQKLEVAQMRFLRLLLCLVRLDRQRNLTLK
jgi:hypothetical protein